MVNYLGKPNYKTVSNDEEDDDANEISRYQGNDTMKLFWETKPLLILLKVEFENKFLLYFVDRRLHMRELRRNESFRRLQRATSRED